MRTILAQRPVLHDLIEQPGFNPTTQRDRGDWSLRGVSTGNVTRGTDGKPECIPPSDERRQSRPYALAMPDMQPRHIRRVERLTNRAHGRTRRTAGPRRSQVDLRSRAPTVGLLHTSAIPTCHRPSPATRLGVADPRHGYGSAAVKYTETWAITLASSR